MANLFDSAADEIFNSLKSSGKKVTLYDEEGNKIYKSSKARKFFAMPDRLMVVLEDDNNDSHISLYFGSNVDTKQITGLITNLRNLAVKYGMLFNLKKYGNKLSPKDFAYQSTPVMENKDLKMFRNITLSNTAQRKDLQRHASTKLGLIEGVDFSVYKNTIVFKEGFEKSSRYLAESTSAIVTEKSADAFLKYATEWFNTRVKNVSKSVTGRNETSDSKVDSNSVVELAKGFRDIIAKNIKVVSSGKAPTFASKNAETAYKLEQVVNTKSGLKNDSLWIYIGSLVDKLQHNEPLNSNEQFFANKLTSIVDSSVVTEDLNTIGVEGDPELGQSVVEFLKRIKNDYDVKGVDITDGVYSMEDLAVKLVDCMKACAISRLDTLIPNHFDDYVKIIREVFGMLSFENEMPEMLAFDRWVNVSVVEGKTSFDTNHFFKVYGTEFWLGRDPNSNDKHYSPSDVIPSIAMYLSEYGGYRSPNAAYPEAVKMFDLFVKPALEKQHGFIFESGEEYGHYKGMEADEYRADAIDFELKDFINQYGRDFNFGDPSMEASDMTYSEKEIIDAIEHYLHSEYEISERYNLAHKSKEIFDTVVKKFLIQHDYIFEASLNEASENEIEDFATAWIEEYISSPNEHNRISRLISVDDTPEEIEEVLRSEAEDIVYLAGKAADRDIESHGTPSALIVNDEQLIRSVYEKLVKIAHKPVSEAIITRPNRPELKYVIRTLNNILPKVSVFEKDLQTFKSEVIERLKNKFNYSVEFTDMIDCHDEILSGSIETYYDDVSVDRDQTGFTLGGDEGKDLLDSVVKY